MKIILDTSVLISIFATKNKSFAKDILKLAFTKQIHLAVCSEIFEEFRNIATNDEVKYLRGWQTSKVAKFIPWYTYNAIFFELENIEVNSDLRDPEDIVFLRLALMSKAEYLVSLDKDLLVIKNIQDTKSVSPEEFIQKHNSVSKDD